MTTLIPILDSIPENSDKVRPENDDHPPKLHNDDWEEPSPISGLINTAGLEDSPYISTDGETLFFFFTPDADVDAVNQIKDGATGIYWAKKKDGEWLDPQRVRLGESPALDGCPTFRNNTLWFCSAREGNFRPIDFWTAEWNGTDWENPRNSGENLNDVIGIGEMEMNRNETQIIFHAQNPDSSDLDIFIVNREAGTWETPYPIASINSPADDSRPALSLDEKELWFTRTYEGSPAIFRSLWKSNAWQEPELIISGFAGEPSVDQVGNIYFTHHFFKDGKMIEADIYIARKKK
jgi:hypothetical protein